MPLHIGKCLNSNWLRSEKWWSKLILWKKSAILIDRKRFMCDSNECAIISNTSTYPSHTSTHVHIMLVGIRKITSCATCRVYEVYNQVVFFAFLPIIWYISIAIHGACAFTIISLPFDGTIKPINYTSIEKVEVKNSTNRSDSFHSNRIKIHTADYTFTFNSLIKDTFLLFLSFAPLRDISQM